MDLDVSQIPGLCSQKLTNRTQFQCGDGTCLDYKTVVNNCKFDCLDGSDESKT